MTALSRFVRRVLRERTCPHLSCVAVKQLRWAGQMRGVPLSRLEQTASPEGGFPPLSKLSRLRKNTLSQKPPLETNTARVEQRASCSIGSTGGTPATPFRACTHAAL